MYDNVHKVGAALGTLGLNTGTSALMYIAAAMIGFHAIRLFTSSTTIRP